MYGDVPPLMDVVVVIVADCPRSRAVGSTEIVVEERAAFTVMLAAFDVTMTEELELSVTWSSNDHNPMVVRAPVEVDADDAHAEETPKLL